MSAATKLDGLCVELLEASSEPRVFAIASRILAVAAQIHQQEPAVVPPHLREPERELPPGAVPRTALVGLGVMKLDALDEQLAAFDTVEELRGYLDQGSVEAWLALLRRNQPDRAAMADRIIEAAWARVREAEATPPWCIVGREGTRTQYGGRDEWLSAWKARVEAVERAPRSVAGRRAVLEAMLRANRHTLRAIERHGVGDAVRDATRASAEVDCRLAAQDGAAPLMAAE